MGSGVPDDEALAHHQVGTSARDTGEVLISGDIVEHFYRSRYYYLVKHFGPVVAAAAELVSLGNEWFHWVKCHVSQDGDSAAINPFSRPPTPNL